jgi:hypothetical protein
VLHEGPEAQCDRRVTQLPTHRIRTPGGARYSLRDALDLDLEVADDVQGKRIRARRPCFAKARKPTQPEGHPISDAPTPAPRRVQGTASES